MHDALDEIKSQVDIAYAAVVSYETIVIGKENYDHYIRPGKGNDSTSEGTRGAFGQPINEVLDRAATRLGIEPRRGNSNGALPRGSEGLPIQEVSAAGLKAEYLRAGMSEGKISDIPSHNESEVKDSMEYLPTNIEQGESQETALSQRPEVARWLEWMNHLADEEEASRPKVKEGYLKSIIKDLEAYKASRKAK